MKISSGWKYIVACFAVAGSAMAYNPGAPTNSSATPGPAGQSYVMSIANTGAVNGAIIFTGAGISQGGANGRTFTFGASTATNGVNAVSNVVPSRGTILLNSGVLTLSLSNQIVINTNVSTDAGFLSIVFTNGTNQFSPGTNIVQWFSNAVVAVDTATASSNHAFVTPSATGAVLSLIYNTNLNFVSRSGDTMSGTLVMPAATVTGGLFSVYRNTGQAVFSDTVASNQANLSALPQLGVGLFFKHHGVSAGNRGVLYVNDSTGLHGTVVLTGVTNFPAITFQNTHLGGVASLVSTGQINGFHVGDGRGLTNVAVQVASNGVLSGSYTRLNFLNVTSLVASGDTLDIGLSGGAGGGSATNATLLGLNGTNLVGAVALANNANLTWGNVSSGFTATISGFATGTPLYVQSITTNIGGDAGFVSISFAGGTNTFTGGTNVPTLLQISNFVSRTGDTMTGMLSNFVGFVGMGGGITGLNYNAISNPPAAATQTGVVVQAGTNIVVYGPTNANGNAYWTINATNTSGGVSAYTNRFTGAGTTGSVTTTSTDTGLFLRVDGTFAQPPTAGGVVATNQGFFVVRGLGNWQAQTGSVNVGYGKVLSPSALTPSSFSATNDKTYSLYGWTDSTLTQTSFVYGAFGFDLTGSVPFAVESTIGTGTHIFTVKDGAGAVSITQTVSAALTRYVTNMALGNVAGRQWVIESRVSTTNASNPVYFGYDMTGTVANVAVTAVNVGLSNVLGVNPDAAGLSATNFATVQATNTMNALHFSRTVQTLTDQPGGTNIITRSGEYFFAPLSNVSFFGLSTTAFASNETAMVTLNLMLGARSFAFDPTISNQAAISLSGSVTNAGVVTPLFIRKSYGAPVASGTSVRQ